MKTAKKLLALLALQQISSESSMKKKVSFRETWSLSVWENLKAPRQVVLLIRNGSQPGSEDDERVPLAFL